MPHIDSTDKLNICSNIRGSSNKHLYKIKSESTHTYWLKIYPEQKKFIQERRAYHILKRNKIPYTPELIHSSAESLCYLLLTNCSGTLASELPTDTSALEKSFMHAGYFLNKLHKIKPEIPDTLLPFDALLKRYKSIIKSNIKTGHIEKDYIEKTKVGLDRLENNSYLLKRSLCHRDFTPRNWLYSNENHISVIDFEHTMFDITILDIAKLNAHYFSKNHKLKEAFFMGYSGKKERCKDFNSVLYILTIFYGLQTLSWGKKYNDKVYIDLGYEALTI